MAPLAERCSNSRCEPNEWQILSCVNTWRVQAEAPLSDQQAACGIVLRFDLSGGASSLRLERLEKARSSPARPPLHAAASKGSSRSSTLITCVADHSPSPRAVGMPCALSPYATARRLVFPAACSSFTMGARSAALAAVRSRSADTDGCGRQRWPRCLSRLAEAAYGPYGT